MTNKPKKSLLDLALIVFLILLIAICFIVTMLIIERHAKNDCFDNIEETAMQMTDMFQHTLKQNQTHLELFANILASNTSNPDEQLQLYMKNFCQTQNFSAVCIHRKNGTTVSYGYHPHDEVKFDSFANEVAQLPYISEVFVEGDKRSQRYIYQAVPIVRGEETVAVLYGYIPLDVLPDFISSTEYDGKCKFYIVDGNTGNFLMNEYGRYAKNDTEQVTEIPLGSLFDGRMDNRKTKEGYSFEEMKYNMSDGRAGHYIFLSENTGDWYYTYYMPIGIHNWSMQVTIDEATAFATYYTIRTTVMILMVVANIFMVTLIVIMVLQNAKAKKRNSENLHKADYLNAVQSALISAHNNPFFVDQALKIIGEEIDAETVLCLTFSDKIISQAQYWPSKDKTQAMALLGINIREVFPVIYDALSSNRSIYLDETTEVGISKSALKIFKEFDIRNILLVPIIDTAGLLRGAIAVVNVPKYDPKTTELLRCVTRDFFMAITNLENHTIIKRMGEMDYLTGLKNRNSFEVELPNYEVMDTESLWCIFVDVNGLHELNNKKGHKAGDLMLCTVADIVKRIFGAKHTYRLGGDEFVAFIPNGTHKELMSKKHRLLDEVAQKGYSVSAGFEGTVKNINNIFEVERILGEAEEQMYRDKRTYYQKNNLPDRGRNSSDDESPVS